MQKIWCSKGKHSLGRLMSAVFKCVMKLSLAVLIPMLLILLTACSDVETLELVISYPTEEQKLIDDDPLPIDYDLFESFVLELPESVANSSDESDPFEFAAASEQTAPEIVSEAIITDETTATEAIPIEAETTAEDVDPSAIVSLPETTFVETGSEAKAIENEELKAVEILPDTDTQPSVIEQAVNTADIDVVYWVEKGEVWHTKSSCPSLSRSKNILSGSPSDAMSAGKSRVCKRCGG